MNHLKTLDREIPRRGPCLICGRRLDARHRIVDAIRGMGSVGMTARMIHAEYGGGFSLAGIKAALAAPPWHSRLHKADIHEDDLPWLAEIEIAKKVEREIDTWLGEKLTCAQKEAMVEPVPPEWIEELEQRIRAIDEQHVKLIPWEEVKKRLVKERPRKKSGRQ